MFKPVWRYVAAVATAVAALTLVGCSQPQPIPHTPMVIDVGTNYTYNDAHVLIPEYYVDFTVTSKIYQQLTGVKTDCTGSPCKSLMGVAISQAAIDKYAAPSQKTILACLPSQTPAPIIHYQMFSAAGSGKKDPSDGVWYPRQIPMYGGGKSSILTSNCRVGLVQNLALTDITIAKG